MTVDEFRQKTANGEPDATLTASMQALWWDARDEWEKAHETCQAEESADCAWVHAYLHRKEGDKRNAQYWYGRAGKSMPDTSLDEEWRAIATTLLGEN